MGRLLTLAALVGLAFGLGVVAGPVSAEVSTSPTTVQATDVAISRTANVIERPSAADPVTVSSIAATPKADLGAAGDEVTSVDVAVAGVVLERSSDDAASSAVVVAGLSGLALLGFGAAGLRRSATIRAAL